jgi:hypothetical protein
MITVASVPTYLLISYIVIHFSLKDARSSMVTQVFLRQHADDRKGRLTEKKCGEKGQFEQRGYAQEQLLKRRLSGLG